MKSRTEKMGSLEKLSEIIGAVKGKKDVVLSAVKDLEGGFEKVLEGFEACFTEIESKEHHLKGLMQESGEEKVGDSCVDGFLEKPEFFQSSFELVQRNEADSVKAVLRRRKEELDSREKELEEMERVLEERQIVMFSEEAKLVRKKDHMLKMLEMRSFEVDSKKRLLMKREKAMHSEAERMVKKKTELHLMESKLGDLAEELEARERMLDRKMKFITEENLQPDEASSASPVTMRMDHRKRSVHSIIKSSRKCNDDGIEMVESSPPDVKRGCFRPDRRFQAYDRQNPGSLRNVLRNQQVGFSFVVTIAPIHEERSHLTVPAKFVGVYDLSSKESVILISDEGSFQLQVKRYDDSRRMKSSHVIFRHGWRRFYSKNKLRMGMLCLFKVKEHNVDGDDSKFSMNVSILSG